MDTKKIFNNGAPTEAYKTWAEEFLLVLKRDSQVSAEAVIDYEKHEIKNVSEKYPRLTWGLEGYDYYFCEGYTPEAAYLEDLSYA